MAGLFRFWSTTDAHDMQIISSTTSEWHHHLVTNRGWEQNYRCFSFRFDVTYDLWLLALVSWTDFQCCTLSTFTQRQWLPTQHRHSHNKSCDALQQPTCSCFSILTYYRLSSLSLSLSLQDSEACTSKNG
ncbi:hypothetical protein FOMG_08187 [Fusarium oxysporum f. sp. melonis 26406]|uniref:Uncharacterized protein n=1 Tax=Fusarium oxysporum f. sp. melonis 26406 TaxID=1089452 RepID=X0AWP3_FUSOX|nr:hypothetical protein FOMG_08187 [Fusarium oxysporum f. sp. melonis 26406]